MFLVFFTCIKTSGVCAGVSACDHNHQMEKTVTSAFLQDFLNPILFSKFLAILPTCTFSIYFQILYNSAKIFKYFAIFALFQKNHTHALTF